MLQRALEIRQTIYGTEHRDIAASLDNLAALKRSEHKPEEAAALARIAALNALGAEPLFLRAAALDEKALGADSPELGTDLNNLGVLYMVVRRNEEAAKVFQRALAIRIKALGNQDPAVAETMNSYAAVLQLLHRDDEAAKMQKQAQAILSKQGGK